MSPDLIHQTFRKLLAGTVALTLLCASISFAHQNAGSIKGTITDQLGSLVVNATVFGPKFLSLNVGVSKTFKFGRPIPPKTAPSAAAGNVVTTTGSQKPPPKQPIQRPYQLSFSIYATNALNHTNEGNPVGNMSSPYFLKSTGSSNIFFFGPGGGGGSAGNRQVTLRVRFSF